MTPSLKILSRVEVKLGDVHRCANLPPLRHLGCKGWPDESFEIVKASVSEIMFVVLEFLYYLC